MDKDEIISLIIIALLIVIAFSLNSCASPPSRSQFCDVSDPYYFDSAAELLNTPDTVKRFIVGHNEMGQTFCGWKPGGTGS